MNVWCKHGDFVNCEDKFNPGTLQPKKWENAMTIDNKAWGFRRDAQLSDFLTTDQLVSTLVETVSCGGNLLMNVGPNADGVITPIFEERLRNMGHWLNINAEAIYGSQPWIEQKDSMTNFVWYFLLFYFLLARNDNSFRKNEKFK